MRESFGGAFMIKLVLVFIIIYVSFMAVAVNYAKAFRVKNQIINILEQNQYSGPGDSKTLNLVERYLASAHYHVDGVTCPSDNSLAAYGVCIEGASGGSMAHYMVYTYISIDFPFFGIRMRLPIRGETKTFVY